MRQPPPTVARGAWHRRRRRHLSISFISYAIIQSFLIVFSAFDISCNARIFFWFFAYYVYKIKIEPSFHSFAASIPVRRAHFRPMRISSHQSCKSHSMQKLSMQVPTEFQIFGVRKINRWLKVRARCFPRRQRNYKEQPKQSIYA